MGDYACPKHQMVQGTPEWEEGLRVMAENVNPKGMKAWQPCPGCLDRLVFDLYEAHNTLDVLQIPRRTFGKNELTITERLALLFDKLDNGERLSELRTS